MKSHVRTLAPVLAGFCFLIAGAPGMHAQITNAVQAHVDHSFVIGDKTLPPGEYTFRMMEGSNLTVMTVAGQERKDPGGLSCPSGHRQAQPASFRAGFSQIWKHRVPEQGF